MIIGKNYDDYDDYGNTLQSSKSIQRFSANCQDTVTTSLPDIDLEYDIVFIGISNCFYFCRSEQSVCVYILASNNYSNNINAFIHDYWHSALKNVSGQ